MIIFDDMRIEKESKNVFLIDLDLLLHYLDSIIAVMWLNNGPCR